MILLLFSGNSGKNSISRGSFTSTCMNKGPNPFDQIINDLLPEINFLSFSRVKGGRGVKFSSRQQHMMQMYCKKRFMNMERK